MTPADKFYMNYSPNCCHRADCTDVNCPGRGQEPPNPQTEAAISAAVWFLCGIGFIAALIAVAIWSLK